MEEIKKGVLGGFSGKVGTVVGATWRGKNIIRSLPTASKKLPTEEQLLQRLKFKTVSRFLQPLRSIIGRYFGTKTELQTRYNLATSYTLTNAVELVGFVPTIRYDRLLITKGEILGFMSLVIDNTDTVLLDMSWADNSNQGNALGTDMVTFVGYCAELSMFMVLEEVVRRDQLAASVEMPTMWVGESVQVWVYLSNALRTQASTSLYGGGTLA